MQTPESLHDGEIYVLRARLSQPPLTLAECAMVATSDERHRAARFRQDADRQRHLLGRSILRLAVGRLLNVEPSLLVLQDSPYGKPSIPDGPSFNIAHSGDEVLIALAARGRLGVDVEAVRDLPDLFDVARTSFVPAEVSALAAQQPAVQLRHFYRIWSRKEAMLKALGIGIGALQSLEVSGEVGIANALLRISLPGESVESWVVRPIAGADSVETAVAWDQPLQRVVVRDVVL